MNTKRQGNSVFLCCGKARCPELKKSKEKKDHYDLSDDFGNKVTLTKEHLMSISEAVKELDDN
jgi:hypothetical protein